MNPILSDALRRIGRRGRCVAFVGAGKDHLTGINQRVAAEVLGHSDLRTTAKYYQHIDRDTVRGVVLQLNPTGTDVKGK